MNFADPLILWYELNKRDLPWRHTSDPYRVWVSEVILQQTRVDQGLSYYERFLERFPDLESLAIAEEEDVMRVWQGLGYYSRARNMHHTAATIVRDHQSVFPASYDDIKRLRGIGDYSASAIASIAFGQVYPVVDGNVLRVVARYAGIAEAVNTSAGRKKVLAFLTDRIDHRQPGVFNQAVMELGALICKPGQPLCKRCPLAGDCFAAKNGMTGQFPRTIKPAKPEIRFYNYLFIYSGPQNNRNIWIRKRTAPGIWKNLYDFPLVEANEDLPASSLVNSEDWQKVTGGHQLHISGLDDNIRHLLSHRELRVRFFFIHSEDFFHPEYQKIRLSDYYNYPVPRLIENFLKKVITRPGIFLKNPD